MTSHYAHLTSSEAAAAADRGDLLILPIGATEQHGEHLPLGTDTLRAATVAEAVASGLHGRALLLPEIGYGISPHHTTRPGTITLPPGVLIDLLCSIADSLVAQGWRRLLIITGHGGNDAALGVLQQEMLSRHPELILAWTPITPLAPAAHRDMHRSEVTGHSGESETSQMLATHPELVRMDQARPGPTSLSDLDGRALLSRSSGPKVAVTFEKYADHGVLGDPRTATAEDGQRIIAEAVGRITAFAQDVIDL